MASGLIDHARMEPVVVSKHGRPVVVILAIERIVELRATATNQGSRSWGILEPASSTAPDGAQTGAKRVWSKGWSPT